MGKELCKGIKINSSVIDEHQNLSLFGLMQIIQEAANMHVDMNHIGWQDLQTEHKFWVVVKFHLIIDRMPVWKERVILKTWGTPMKHFLHYRDFEMFDTAGNSIIRINSDWVVLDTNTGKPTLSPLNGEEGVFVDRHTISEPCKKIKPIDISGEHVYKQVVFSDLDYNNHVNNTRYVQWCIDDYGEEFVSQHIIKEGNINFLAQAHNGDEYGIVKKEVRPNDIISSIFSKEGVELCRIEILWKDKN